MFFDGYSRLHRRTSDQMMQRMYKTRRRNRSRHSRRRSIRGSRRRRCRLGMRIERCMLVESCMHMPELGQER